MPIYDFQCNDTGRYFEIKFSSYTDYENATITSPFTGSPNVTRIISRVGIVTSEMTRWSRIEAGDVQAMSELEESDPAALGRALRHFGDKAEQDMGDEFNEVIDRLTTGDTPEQIEASLPARDDGRWLEGLGAGIPGTPSYEPEAPPPPGYED